MTFLNAKKVIVVSGCVFVLNLTNLSVQATDASVTTASAKQAAGKVLACPEMGMLNSYLEVDPLIVLRMEMAYSATNKARQAANGCSSNDKKFIEQQITSILAPVKQFFGKIRDVSMMVRPLVEKSLLSELRSPQEQDLARSTCLILRFLDSKDDTDTFFTKNVSTKDELILACTEFATFFKDIKASLSPVVTQKYEAIVKKLEENKKQVATRGPAAK